MPLGYLPPSPDWTNVLFQLCLVLNVIACYAGTGQLLARAVAEPEDSQPHHFRVTPQRLVGHVHTYRSYTLLREEALLYTVSDVGSTGKPGQMSTL